MYTWKITFHMKNGGIFEGYYRGPENNSADVAQKVCTGRPDDFTGLFGENDSHNLYVKLGEIQAYDISIM